MIEETVKIKTIKNVLDEFVIQLPSFQRAYTWTKEDIILFLDDIINKSKDQEYYIGVIYYVMVGNKVYLIDGQQRLTTLLLILNAIRIIDSDLFSDSGIDFFYGDLPKFDFEVSSPFCSNLLNCDSIDGLRNSIDSGRDLNFSKINLLINSLIILDRLSLEKKLDVLLNAVINNVRMLFVECESIQLGSQIFENINSKGQELSNIDLIKNAYFSRIKNVRGEKEFDSYKYKTWKKIEENFFPDMSLENSYIQLNKKNQNSMKNFHQLFSIFIQLKNGKKHSNKSRKLYVEYLDKLDGYNQQELKKEMDELYIVSKNLRYINNPFDSSIPMYEFIQQHIIFLKNELGIKMFVPVVVALLVSLENGLYRSNKKGINKLLSKISIFHFVFNTVYSMRPSLVEKFYNDISYEIYTNKISFKKIKTLFDNKFNEIISGSIGLNVDDHISKLSNVLFTLDRADESMWKVKGYKKFSDSLAIKIILGNIEAFLRDDFASIPIIDTVEHISSLDGDKKKDVNNFNIFNFLPLEEHLNGMCDTKSLNEKVEIYKKSNYKLTKEFCKIYNQIEEDKFMLEWQLYLENIIVQILTTK